MNKSIKKDVLIVCTGIEILHPLTAWKMFELNLVNYLAVRLFSKEFD